MFKRLSSQFIKAAYTKSDSMQLIISEKPAAAEKIAAALGKSTKKVLNKVAYFEIPDKDIIVVPAVGHLFTLAQKEKTWKYPVFDLEWKPTYETEKAAFAKPYLENIKKLAKGAEEFVVATDYDIEGEVIGLNIIRFLCNQKDAKRMKFSTLTAGDLKDAYEGISPTLDWGQAEAGETRHWLDWWWGVNLSKAATDALFLQTHKYQTLSIGRVQGPSLAILAKREIEIQQFKPVPYWQISILMNLDNQKFEALHKEEKFFDEKRAKQVFDKIKDMPATVSTVDTSRQNVTPPTPFDLTSLQIEAYRVFRINPKQTLEIAQVLYTAAYISYPRTSSQKLPSQLNYRKLLTNLAMQPEYSKLAQRILANKNLKPNEGKKSDSAHPSIYPTGEIPKSLNTYQKKIYDLIVKRFLAVFADSATRETTAITFDVEEEPFILKGTRTVEQGWQEFYAPYVRKEEIELPKLAKGQEFAPKSKNVKKQTEPPKRYTQASIIKELEKRSLGTKATRASILDTLYQRGYVTGTSITVTPLGLQIVQTFTKYASDILDEKLTRHFEKDMEKIREQKQKKEVVLEEAKKLLIKITNGFKLHINEIGRELVAAVRETRREAETLMTCPNCKIGDIRVITSKASGKRFLACNKYPDCRTTYPLPQSGLLKMLDKQCKDCNTPMIMVISKGKRPWEFCPNPGCPGKKKTEAKPEQSSVAPRAKGTTEKG
jgi:DNA topoisomerase-1